MQLSILNVVPVRAGESVSQAFEQMTDLAQYAEKLGYARYWVAEHHNTKGFASSATVLLMQHLLSKTNTIRIGSGGIMLPNHSPYIVAEQIGTLETLYPKRVDLGLGRAPGTDHNTARAIRRTNDLYSDFAGEIHELRGYFKDSWNVHAYPAAGLNVPFYILGSSTDSAYLAAELGLPYAFASHFAPAMLEQAVSIYRKNFKPSEYLAYPYVIMGINMVAADTDEEARRLRTTQTQGFLNIVRGKSEGLLPPVESEEALLNSVADDLQESAPHFGPVAFKREDLLRDLRQTIHQMGGMTLCGSPETLAAQYRELKKQIPFDELMINSFIYDPEAQKHSFEIFKQVVDEVENEENEKN